MLKQLLVRSLAFSLALAAVSAAQNARAASVQQSVVSASPSVQSNSVSGAAIVQKALAYLGYRYTTVGNSPTTGFSCIGFVSYVYGANGIALPDDLDSARAYAPPVPFSSLLPGDVLFFQNTVWPGLSHTAIYLGAGKFIHAEYYNRGVVVSSFNRDPVDGNYWIAKFLGANRPWQGVAGVSVVPPDPVPSEANPVTPAAPSSSLLPGSTGVVTVPALNVRAAASPRGQVQQVVVQGDAVAVIGRHGSWYHVQLTDGETGWVITAGIRVVSDAQVPPISPKGVPQLLPTSTVTSIAGSQPLPTPTATPPAMSKPHDVTVALPVPWVRVRSAPSLHASVVTIITQGRRVVVLAHSHGWVQVRLADGRTGWVSQALLEPPPAAAIVSPPHASTSVMPPSSSALVTIRAHVHTAPSVAAPVLATVADGTHVQVRAHRSNWALVRLPSGTSGYILSAYLHQETGPSDPSGITAVP